MTESNITYSRRRFLKIAGAAGMGSLITMSAGAEKHPVRPIAQQSDTLKVPMRSFGQSGIQVSALGLGGMFDIAANQLMLKQAIRWGATYWDTADCYHRGSEAGIGKYFGRYPDDRKKVFVVTKSDARDPEGLDRLLKRSLERMHTSYVDLYLIHGIRDISEIDERTRRWAEGAKAGKQIRLFGFSTHSNMEECLLGAARLGWIDGIMMTYNYRNMFSSRMQEAVDACVKEGIGLTAMKTQAGRSWFSPEENEALKPFLAKGFTEEQARLKAVWQSPHIASICSQMDSMKLLKANVAAAADNTVLSKEDIALLQRYAYRTRHQHCAGCSRICESAVAGQVPIGDVMRYHMYCSSYGRPEWAKAHFKAIPESVRQQMARLDFSEAERRCPNRMPVGQLMREALDAFA